LSTSPETEPTRSFEGSDPEVARSPLLFHALDLAGAYLVEPSPRHDARGFFARTFCERAFLERGLDPRVAQCSISYNRHAGTLRGMHFQAAPHAETKLVRCVQGRLHDVIIDLRPGSPTHGQHVAVELSAKNRRAVYVPAGFAHGFQTLDADTEVLYQISAPHAPEAARGVRFDDPAFGIAWPVPVRVISERDALYPDFDPRKSGA
jgi:dTDP-4-dehydrorhamnose 3,5-epimerase